MKTNLDEDYICHEDAIEIQGRRDHILVGKYGGYGWWVEKCFHEDNFDLKIVLKAVGSKRRRVLTKGQFDKFSRKLALSCVKTS